MKSELTSIENKLRALLLDEDWPNALKPWMKGVNVFDALRISRSENRHSNMLAWLLAPDGSHGLGCACLDGLIKHLCHLVEDKRATSFLTADWSVARVYREWGNDKNRVDLLIELQMSQNKSLIIAIENKIDSVDRRDQLSRYHQLVLKQWPEEYNNGRHIFVYLTPNGDDPINAEGNDDWIRCSYQDVARIVEGALSDVSMCASNINYLISDYINLIRRDIVADEKLRKLCNAIYKKHKEAFELIFKNADMDCGYKQAKERIMTILRDNASGIIYAGDRTGTQSVLAFQSEAMNKILVPLKDEECGTWNNRDVYYYWFNIDRRIGKIMLVVEFGPLKLSTEENAPMRVMGRIINSKKKLDNGVYRRMKSYPVMDVTEDDIDEQKLSSRVRSAIKKLKEDEKGWIEKYCKNAHALKDGKENNASEK